MKSRVAAVLLGVVAAGGTLFADTLVLRDGRRVQGELVGVSRGEIQFEERSGRDRRALRIPRHEVLRIEFDSQAQAGWTPWGQSQQDGPSGGVPRGMRERHVNVSAREPWTDTGVDIRPGQTFYVASSGEIRWGRERRDGPAGESNSPYNAGRPLPDRPAAALLARIGDDLMFVGGQSGPFRVRSGGRLYLGINDDVFEDNTGAFRVTLSY
jgi:hypothetical protein